MKIHQTIGIVAGVHALAFLLIFASPGCSSTTKSAAAATPAPAPDPVAAAAPPAGTSAAPAAPAWDGASAVPLVPSGAAASANVFYTPTRPNTAAAEALAPAGAAPEVTPAETYTVRSGDSLWLVAHRHHLKVSELAAANNLRATSALHAGQKLLIPGAAGGSGAAAPGAQEGMGGAGAGPKTAGGGFAAGAGAEAGGKSGPVKYTVKNGDKLSTIARHFGLTTGALAAENSISDPRKIRPGQVLTIPAGGTARKGGATGKRTRSGTARPAAAAPEAAAPAPANDSSPAPANLEQVPAAPSASAPGGAAPSSNVPIIRIEGADTSSPSAAPAR